MVGLYLVNLHAVYYMMLLSIPRLPRCYNTHALPIVDPESEGETRRLPKEA